MYLAEGSKLLGTVVPAEQQALDLGGASAGTFTLTVNVSGTSYTTSVIQHNATAANIAAALMAAQSSSSVSLAEIGSEISVSTDFVITFGGALKGIDLDLVTINASALTSGSTPSITGVIDGTQWKFSAQDYPSDLPDGTHEIFAVPVDEFGNFGTLSSSLTFAVEASGSFTPAILGLGTDTGRPADGVTSETTPSIKGTGVPGGQVVVKVFSSAGALVETATAVTVDGSGFWTTTLSALSSGTYFVEASAVGAPASLVSPRFTITVDTAVEPPTFSTQTGVVGTGLPSLSGSAEANGRVRILDGGVVIGESNVTAGGTWSFIPVTPLADGIHTLTAISVDLAGNISTASTPIGLTIATAAPSVTFGLVAGNDVVSGNERDGAGVTLSGTVSTGSSVSVSFGTQTRLASVDAGTGRWEYRLQPADYEVIGAQDGLEIRVTATNALGVATTRSRTIDFKTAPVATPGKPVFSAIAGGNVTVVVSAGAAGSITGTQTVSANAIILNSATDIDVRTNVSTAVLNAKGTSVSLKNDGALSLSATLEDGDLKVTSGGTMRVDLVEFTNDIAGNSATLLAGNSGALAGEEDALRRRLAALGFTSAQIDTQVLNHNSAGKGIDGGVLIDEIRAGTHGDVVVRTSGDVREVLTDDLIDILFDTPAYAPPAGTDRSRSIDVTAKSFKAVGRNKSDNSGSLASIIEASQLEFSSNLEGAAAGTDLTLGWADPLTVTSGTDLEIAGYYNGDVTVTGLTGQAEIIGIFIAGALTVSAKEVNASGLISANGAVSLTAQADGVYLGAGALVESRSNAAVSITTSAGGDIVMGDRATIDTDGAISITTTGTDGDFELARIRGGAGSVTINVTGQVTDADTEVSVSQDVANIVTSGALSITAAGGLGEVSDRLDLDVSPIDLLSSAGADMYLDLRRNPVNVKDIDARLLDLKTEGSVEIGGAVAAESWDLTTLVLDVTGDVTDTGALNVSGVANIKATGDITLDTPGNLLEVQLQAVNATISDSDGITVGGTLTGSLSVTATEVTLDVVQAASLGITATGTISDVGKVSVTGVSTLSATANIVLDHADNDFGGLVTVTSAVDTTINDVNALNLKVASTGALAASAGTTLTLDNPISAAQAVLSGQTGIQGSGAVVVAGATSLSTRSTVNERQILDVGVVTAGTFTVTVDVGGTTYTTAAIAFNASGDDVQRAINAALTPVADARTSVKQTGAGRYAVEFLGSLAGQNLIPMTVNTAGLTVTTAGAGVTTDTDGSGADISLSNAANDFGTVTVTGARDVTLTDTDEVAIEGSVSRDLDITAGGVLTANTLSTGNDLDLNVAGAAIAGTVTVAGDLGLTTSSAVTDTGSLTVSGETAITAGANTVTLDSAGNDFIGAVDIVSAGTVALVDRSALEVSGTLDDALNVTTGGTLVLGATNIGSNTTPTAADLVIQSGGAITQKAGSDLTIYGDVAITAGANDVSLTAATNEITNQFTLTSAQNVAITVVDTNNDDTALTIGDFNAAGNVSIATDAALTQASTAVGSELNIAGDLTLAVSGKGADICSDINLTNENNELLGDVRILNGEDVEIRTASALHLVSATICNNLNVFTGGKVYNSDAWVVVGDVVIDAGGADVDLTAGHDFKGSVSILDARNVVLNDVNTLSFDDVDISGALTLTAGGAVSQTADSTFTVDGASTITAISNATYRLALTGVTSGAYTLSTIVDGSTYTTTNIAYDATAATIRAAILASLSTA
ncbi:MAG: hypothetical protein EBS77_07620, partial [Gammaproteobacteria bacterium]|nr:hypothetical protein [Gammaproteobacteria bacterium]